MIDINVLKKTETKDCFSGGGKTASYMDMAEKYLKEHNNNAYSFQELYTLIILDNVDKGKVVPITSCGFYNIIRKMWLSKYTVHRKGIYYFYDKNYTDDIESKEKCVHKHEK